MLYHVTIGGRSWAVDLTGDRVTVDGADAGSAELVALPGTPVRHMLVSGQSTTIVAQRSGGGWSLHVDGWPLHAEVIDERARAIRAMTNSSGAAQGPRPVRAPMPGLIVRVEVAAGDRVRAGQPVIAMEAMKMENELKAESDGIVTRIAVERGQAVEKGMVLVELGALA
jgi:acetyl/propionyl-CoA carboxylase alpha subunit